MIGTASVAFDSVRPPFRYLTGTPWSEDFMRQYAAALDGVKEQTANIGAERTKPGSFDALCVSYYRSPDFLGTLVYRITGS